MSRPERSTAAGRAYLDLQTVGQNVGSVHAGVATDVRVRAVVGPACGLGSPFPLRPQGRSVVGSLGNRRPTQDADLLALGISNDHATVIRYVNEIASIDLHDAGTFDPETTIARTIRDNDLYLGGSTLYGLLAGLCEDQAQTGRELR